MSRNAPRLSLLLAGGAFVLSALLTACFGEPRIDGSNRAAYERSYAEMRAALPFEQRFRLDTAVMVVSLEDLDFEDPLAVQVRLEDPIGEALAPRSLERLDGRTAAELIALSDSLRAAAESTWRRRVEDEIAALEARRDSAAAIQARLEAFRVRRARIQTEEGAQGREVIIELTVTNDTPARVTWARFLGSLDSDGRNAPWVRDAFEHRPASGLAPGATTTWRIRANRFGQWRWAAGAPRQAVLTVTVTDLEGADGRPLFGDARWGSTDQARLEALRAAVPPLPRAAPEVAPD